MDGKKFLFLSRAQRWTISLGLMLLMAVALLGVIYGPHSEMHQHIGNVSAEALKLLLTASAGWVLVLLYTSSNSFERIEQETVAFLTRDLCRSAEQGGRRFEARPGIIDDTVPLSMACIASTRTSVTYEVAGASDQRMHFWCNLNVCDMETVFMLPSEHADHYEAVYAATLNGFRHRNLSVTSFGLVTHRFHADGQPRQYLELYVTQTFERDFLFDAAARIHAAQALQGDLRSFLVSGARAVSAG
ncbi:MAG: hypothetical protein C3F19_03525 [Rhodocyclales bacterium]|nr:MAG: hypothetical protein C3F19_03525 [Rhodocyclales bacterium]